MSFAISAVRSLKAAWRVITLDSDGLRDFSLTSDAFWGSFKALWR